MKHEDNKHTIAKNNGLCVFFKLSSGSNINKPYEKCSTGWHIISIEDYQIYFLNYSVIKNGKRVFVVAFII